MLFTVMLGLVTLLFFFFRKGKRNEMAVLKFYSIFFYMYVFFFSLTGFRPGLFSIAKGYRYVISTYRRLCGITSGQMIFQSLS